MAEQNSGWASTPYFAALTPQTGPDVKWRSFLARNPAGSEYSSLGILSDDAVLAERIRGRGRYVDGGGSTGSGAARINSYGGGSTPSDPGGYNYKTLQNIAENTGNLTSWAFSARATNRQRKAAQEREARIQTHNKAVQSLHTAMGYDPKGGSAYGMLLPMSPEGAAMFEDINNMPDYLPGKAAPSSNRSRTVKRTRGFGVGRPSGNVTTPPSSPPPANPQPSSNVNSGSWSNNDIDIWSIPETRDKQPGTIDQGDASMAKQTNKSSRQGTGRRKRGIGWKV